VLCFAVLGFLILGGFTAKGWRRVNELERFIEYTYQRSFIELATGIGAVDTALQKGLYATSPVMVAQLASEISHEAAAAQALLSQLPFRTGSMEKTSQFLTQVSDYSAALSRRAAAGRKLEAEETENLRTLASSARSIALELGDLQAMISAQKRSVGEIIMAENPGGGSWVYESFSEMESSVQNLPSLVYDGPFSAHLDKKTARATKGLEDIDVKEALEKAHSVLQLKSGQLSFAREVEGKIPAYCFTGHLNGGEISVDITKAGGLPLGMTNTRVQQGAKLDTDACKKKAEEFLKRCGYGNMTASYWIDTGEALLINYAYQQDGVVCYPDLVKVGVARDNGEIVQFEARGYILNHTEKRDLPAPAVDAETAKAALTPDLTLKSDRLCIIPSPGEYERFCYELTCESKDGTHVLVYVGTETGIEEKILILIEDENGTLAV
jgi:germination protein YpeB